VRSALSYLAAIAVFVHDWFSRWALTRRLGALASVVTDVAGRQGAGPRPANENLPLGEPVSLVDGEWMNPYRSNWMACTGGQTKLCLVFSTTESFQRGILCKVAGRGGFPPQERSPPEISISLNQRPQRSNFARTTLPILTRPTSRKQGFLIHIVARRFGSSTTNFPRVPVKRVDDAVHDLRS
jgi:hypothetical protein